jgi:hypothetical protein
MGDSKDFFSFFFHSSPTLMIVGLTQLLIKEDRNINKRRQKNRKEKKRK